MVDEIQQIIKNNRKQQTLPFFSQYIVRHILCHAKKSVCVNNGEQDCPSVKIFQYKISGINIEACFT